MHRNWLNLTVLCGFANKEYTSILPANFEKGHNNNSLPHSCSVSSCNTPPWGGALHDETQNSCEGDYNNKNFVELPLVRSFYWEMHVLSGLLCFRVDSWSRQLSK